MKKFFLALSMIVLFMSTHNNAIAQYYFFDDEYYDSPILYEAGISLNAMNSLTDIGGTKGIGRKFFKDLNIGYTHASGGVFFSVAYKNAVALRLEGTFGKISANDKVLSNVPVTDIAFERFNRNLNFRSYISEVALLLEIHPKYIFIDWPARDDAPPRTSPYIIAGVGYFSFNPQTKLAGSNRWIDLQPLHTEGQGFAEYGRKNYNLSQINIPLGAGLKYELSPLVNLRGEFVYRKTFTDYIDDLSTTYIDPALFSKYLTPQQEANAKLLYDRQILNHAGIDGKRGTVTNKDAYFTFNLKLSVVIGRERMRR
ncbi:MAG: hypothetical protein ABL929_12650 [Ferruginibacter sp.]|nr:hypothetical protein [Ferruginibacter sp.]